jgi:hypothetical protein
MRKSGTACGVCSNRMLVSKRSSVAMGPANGLRLRTHTERDIEEPLIVAVARPEHKDMLAKADRPPVAVDGRMVHGKQRHRRRELHMSISIGFVRHQLTTRGSDDGKRLLCASLMAPHGSGTWPAEPDFQPPDTGPSDAVVFARIGSMLTVGIDRIICGVAGRGAAKAHRLARHRTRTHLHAISPRVCFQETAKLNSMADIRREAVIRGKRNEGQQRGKEYRFRRTWLSSNISTREWLVRGHACRWRQRRKE